MSHVNEDPNNLQYPSLNPHEAPQSAQHPTFPDVSPLGTEFTDIPMPDDRQTLWRSIYALGQNMDNFAQHQHHTTAATTAVMQSMVDRLASAHLSSGSGSGAPKFRDPRMFNGKSNQVEPFLREIRNAIDLQRRVLVTQRDKTRYFSLYLQDGTPTSWYTTIERTPEKQRLLDDFEGLVKEFIEHFDEPDRYSKALRNLRKLRQTGSTADYTARFLEYVSDLNWTDQTKIQHYFDGLKDSVQDTLVNRKGRYFTEDFVVFYKLCITIDNELHELSLNRRAAPSSSPSHAKKFFPPPAPTPVASSSANPDVVPMEVDAIRRGPLTAEEKNRRRTLGLCLYCGQGQHRANACPNKSAKAKANESKAKPSTGNA
ncbi:hypothetical protein D9611_002010 [Ephemerocybe angulata]|uniref:Retrotransposon gag domain-containing protein n=1 Tax=Ephemerocybe angulata TaxID=980116 RepID=A0A8H5CJJ6_9AGAR|nr:hypothetical protein D9611_002010 [Tulosesus angulatus]